MNQFFKNYLSTNLFIILSYLFYINIDYFYNVFNNTYSFKFIEYSINTIDIFHIIILAYLILLIPFYIFHKNESKALIVIKYFKKSICYLDFKITNKEKVSILSWIIKIFFAPLMIIWLTDHIVTMINNIYLSYNDIGIVFQSFLEYFNKHFFWLFFSIILFADVLFFTLGYLLESPKLKNTIKSVDTSFVGWFVVLICYPPFNIISTDLIGWYSKTFPYFTNDYIHIILNISILILMGIYSRASISLGLKASNLTNRGIIKKGPYKYIRHPAYITKILTWWIGVFPLLIGNIVTNQPKHFFIVLFSIITWSFIYYLRAITEENHLSKDKEYIKYKKEVKYKFIPKIY